ncbi:peptidase U32 family protein [Geoalkalibacter sp.]|uniref:peptidase U32 family protein n=1 Tax=Geoalkalibacter sp. TaxID=3041440 RepID=UPI00272E05F7|nr:U32 family peptidase [Geoalkalibacter sp.]
MRIISPVDNLAEAQGLLDAGADELYGGYVPAAWAREFGLLASINQRTFAEAQIGSFDELAAIIALVHERNGRFSLTLNAPFYAEAMLPHLLAYVDEAVAAGIDGVILADLGLLRLLARRHPRLPLHASTLAHLGNSEAVRFFHAQGISRAVLPRHLSLAEMTTITARVPGVRFDAFLLVGKCPNTEGLCTFHHSSPDRIWPCEIPYQLTALEEPASPRLVAAMARQASWATTNRRHGCGLCAIPHLAAAGIDGLKLVGRGAPAAQKVKNILLARDFLRLAINLKDFDDYRRQARRAHRQRFGSPCSPNVCYYPEFYEAE